MKLPLRVERRLGWIVVTPRMHGIHHSIVRSEINSNWSSGLSLWDRLHGTLRLDVPQQGIVIGVPGYDGPSDVTLGRMIELPFTAAPPGPIDDRRASRGHQFHVHQPVMEPATHRFGALADNGLVVMCRHVRVPAPFQQN